MENASPSTSPTDHILIVYNGFAHLMTGHLPGQCADNRLRITPVPKDRHQVAEVLDNTKLLLHILSLRRLNLCESC